MNFLSKKARLKLMVQALVVTSVFGVGIEYNSGFAAPISVSALENDSTNTGSTSAQTNDIKNIKCNAATTIFMKNDGTVWGCGLNTSGQLGLGNVLNQTSIVEVPITDVKEIVSGGHHTFYKKNDGTVWGTGYNAYGQLGIGNLVNQTTPVQVPITNVEKIVCGVNHTVFKKSDGTIWVTGYNVNGELGIRNNINQTTPVQVLINDVKDIICGNNYTIFKKNDGTIWSCGLNTSGQLGIGNLLSQTIPVQVPITNVKEIVSGGNHTIFKKNDGTVWGCGLNTSGQLGIGNATNQSSIVQVSISDVEEIICGENSTIFKKNTGTIWATGNNAYGGLGIGNTVNQTTPVQVPINNVKDIVLGDYHTFFIKDDGSAWGCGLNTSGQLGIGNVANQTLPVALTSKWFKGTDYTLNEIYNNLSDFDSYGAVLNGVYGKTIFDNDQPFSYKSDAAIILGKILVQDSNLRLKEVLPNGSAITVDNYGSVQFYSTLTTAPVNISLDGTAIKNINYGMVDQTPIIMFYKSDGSISYVNPVDKTLSLKTLPINQSEFTKTSIYQIKNAVAKYFLFQKTNGDLVYFNVNGVEMLTGININNVKQIIPSTTNNSTLYVMNDGTLKYIGDYGQAINVTLPTGTVIESVLSNRFIAVSNGFVYALNNNTAVDIKVLTNATNSAVNNVLWLKNGTVQTLAINGTVPTLAAVNGSLMKAIIPFDNNNAYVLNLDNTTYGIGNLVATTNLKTLNIDYNDIAGFISNNDSSVNGKVLVMKDGTVYTTPSKWAKSAKIVLGKTALSQVQKTMAVTFDVDADTDDLSIATKAVVTAETTKTQADLNYARGLVNNLVDSTNKTALIVRLDELQAKIDANAQALAKATSAVEAAEKSITQADVDVARPLVKVLMDGKDKTDLQKRLDDVQAKINPTNPDPETDKSISLNKSSISLKVGVSDILTATTKSVAAQVTWKSSDSSIATVDSNGNVTGVKQGQVTITATATDGSNLSATCSVTVISDSQTQGVVLNVEPEKSNIHLNEIVSANLTIDNITEIAAEDIRIKYDSSKLQFVGIDEIDGIKLVKSEKNNGELRFIVASKGLANIVNSKKILLKINFKGIAQGEALVDVIKGKVSDGIQMEKDLSEAECGQATITIDDTAVEDVNKSGEFTLLDLAIDARHLGENPTTLSEYNTDQVLNGAIDEDDLLKIGEYMLSNSNYKFN